MENKEASPQKKKYLCVLLRIGGAWVSKRGDPGRLEAPEIQGMGVGTAEEQQHTVPMC